jgi:hypothetical protein
MEKVILMTMQTLQVGTMIEDNRLDQRGQKKKHSTLDTRMIPTLYTQQHPRYNNTI